MSSAETDAPRFQSLIPQRAAGSTVTAEEALGDWWLAGEKDQRLALNMIASVDGRIAVNGRSGGLGGPADRSLFHALRARAHAVMAAAGTVRAERYGPLIRDLNVRATRVARGLTEQPIAVIVSRRLDLDAGLPLLADRGSHIVILTPSAGDLPYCQARGDYNRTTSLGSGLAELHATYGIRLVLCEGGPSLNASLAAESLIDELFLSISPQLVGDTPGAGALLSNDAPDPPMALELRMLLEHDSQLYAHYVSPD